LFYPSKLTPKLQNSDSTPPPIPSRTTPTLTRHSSSHDTTSVEFPCCKAYNLGEKNGLQLFSPTTISDPLHFLLEKIFMNVVSIIDHIEGFGPCSFAVNFF